MQSAAASLKQTQVCERLYKESVDRRKRVQAKQLAYEAKLEEQAKQKASHKSTKLVYAKLAKDIERVLEAVDTAKTGFLEVKQFGRCLSALRVFTQTFASKVTNSALHDREQLLLMHLWRIVNPYGQQCVEARVIFAFLKLVVDPFCESLPELIEQAEMLANDIRDI